MIIGKYLSGIGKFDYLIVPIAGFETQLRASRLLISLGMRTLGVTRQREDGRLQGGMEIHHIAPLEGVDDVA